LDETGRFTGEAEKKLEEVCLFLFLLIFPFFCVCVCVCVSVGVCARVPARWVT